MQNSKAIAGILGPALMAITGSEAFHLDLWARPLPTVTYLDGCLLFVAGLAILRTHNIWTWRWPVLVTLMGWLGVLAGAFRMFAPEAQKGGDTAPLYVVIAVLFAVGCVLTIKAYERDAGAGS